MTTVPGRRMLVAVILIAALGALGLATLGAAADRGPLAVMSGEGLREPGEAEPEQDAFEEPDWSTPEVEEPPPESETTRSGLLTAAIAVAAAILVVLMIWLIRRMQRLARPAPATAAEAAEDEELTAEQARIALDEARDRLETVVDAHDAVIAAWLALERAIAEAGIRRLPAQTTLEFVVAVLGALELDRGALDHLAHLYRRALFDPEPLEEPDRAIALDLLDRLTAQLGAAAGRDRS